MHVMKKGLIVSDSGNRNPSDSYQYLRGFRFKRGAANTRAGEMHLLEFAGSPAK